MFYYDLNRYRLGRRVALVQIITNEIEKNVKIQECTADQ